jgi:hypothetical protein
MCILLALVGFFVDRAMPNCVLFCIVGFNLVYQSSQGPGFWVYCGDVATHAALGLGVSVMMMVSILQTSTAITIMTGPVGVNGLFYALAGFQVLTLVHLYFGLKETKGKSAIERQKLYDRSDK